ncbi:hypothetical protein [Actinoplanes sp. NPDC049599]|uniref:hypothetical protein n=1 Tax=Actinoplanes sp. NPDC049599 TaxID=3363903 RepID=UPI0037A0D21F
MSEQLAALKAKGHWRVAIRPLPFVESRLPPADLERVLAERQVQIRGWHVPHISNREPVINGTDWIGQESSFGYHVEAWRFFTSGQFALVRGFQQDWRESSPYQPWDSPLEISAKRIQVSAVLFFFTEVLELATRLSLSPAGSDRMNIRITTAGLAGRQLVVEDQRRAEFNQPYISGEDEVTFEKELSRDDLVANGAAIAVSASRKVFGAFGWRSENPAILDDYQASFLRQ